MTLERKVAEAGPERPRPRPRRATAMAGDPTMAGTMLGLQRSAGNAAVGRTVSARNAQAAAPPAGAAQANSSMALQLGALWNDLVVLPLARAYERLSRPKPDEDAALADIDFALRGIATVKVATPAEDRNRARLEILEVRVTGLRDLVQETRAKGKSQVKLEQQMIEWRVEATALGPELTHGPRLLGDESAGGEAEPAAAPSTTAPATGGPSEKTPDGSPSAETSGDETIAGLWHQLVVDDLWQGQRALEESPGMAHFYFLLAVKNVGYFALGTPKEDPNRLRLIRLFHGIGAVSDIVGARAGELGDSLINAASDAYDLASTAGKYLTGKPVDESEQAPAAEAAVNEASEPEFTWEREEQRPFQNDTELERP